MKIIVEKVFKSDFDLVRYLKMACNDCQDPFELQERLEELAEQGIYIDDFRCDYHYLSELM